MPTPAEIAAILKTAAAAYPDRKLDKTTLMVYVENLEDIPSRLLAAAVKYHIQTVMDPKNWTQPLGGGME